MSQGILIHWDVITDPFALLKTIVINKNINKRIFVRKSELFVSFWDGYQVPVERGICLSEINNRKLLLEIITEMPWTNKNNFNFNWQNLYLSISILDFALNEGIINIIEEDISEKGWDLFSTIKKDPLFENVIADITALPFYEGWMCVTDGYVHKANSNLAFSLEYKLDLVVNSSKFDSIGYGEKLFKKDSTNVFDLQSKVIKEANLTKWSEFQYLITEPELFFKLTNTSKEIIEKEALDDEIKLFIPKYIGDFFTFGGLSIGHLAYKKFINWKNNNYKKQ